MYCLCFCGVWGRYRASCRTLGYLWVHTQETRHSNLLDRHLAATSTKIAKGFFYNRGRITFNVFFFFLSGYRGYYMAARGYEFYL